MGIFKRTHLSEAKEYLKSHNTDIIAVKLEKTAKVDWNLENDRLFYFALELIAQELSNNIYMTFIEKTEGMNSISTMKLENYLNGCVEEIAKDLDYFQFYPEPVDRKEWFNTYTSTKDFSLVCEKTFDKVIILTD